MPRPISTSLGRQIAIAESALKRNTTLRNFFKIEQNAAGDGFDFVFTATGDRFGTAEKAVDYITGLQITDYRTFNKLGLGEGERRGAKHIGEEAKALNTSLQSSTMDLRTQEIFRRMGLEQYMDQEMTVEYLKFDFGGGKEELAQFMDSPFGREHGMLNITDDGIMVMRYRDAAGKVLDATQMKQLQYALGLGSLTPEFVSKIMKGDASAVGKAVAKLPKRYKALYSARGFAIAGEDLEESILEFHAARLAKAKGISLDAARSLAEARGLSTKLEDSIYNYDDIGSFFKGLFSMKDLTTEEKYLLSMGMEIRNKEMNQFAKMKISGSMDESKPIPQQVKTKLKEMVSHYSQIMSDTDLNDFIQRLGGDYAAVGGDANALKKKLQEIIDTTDKTLKPIVDKDYSYAQKAMAIFNGVERARDGEAITSTEYWESRIGMLTKKLDNLRTSIGIPIGLEEQSMIDDIEKEIEAIQYKISHAKSQTMRGGFQGSSLKFEDIARSFEGMPKKLQDKMMIVYGSSLKNEISQGKIEGILMDMSMSAPKPVRVDPLMLMYHPDYLNSEDFYKGMSSVVDRQIQKAEEFMKTGVVDKSIIDSIRREAEAPIDQYSRTFASKNDKSKTASYRNTKSATNRCRSKINSCTSRQNYNTDGYSSILHEGRHAIHDVP
jgi:chemotaxis regulatin CheY-phosphate phosphatase CheZ